MRFLNVDIKDVTEQELLQQLSKHPTPILAV